MAKPLKPSKFYTFLLVQYKLYSLQTLVDLLSLLSYFESEADLAFTKGVKKG